MTVWQQAASLTVHLVNLTNAMFMKGPVRELLPIGEQTVRVQLPAGKTARQVHLLRNGVTPTWHSSDGYVMVKVPIILDHEVVAIDF